MTTTGVQPPPRYGQAMVLDKSTMSFYVIGGYNERVFSIDVHKLDLIKKHWEVLYLTKGDCSEPPPR